MRLKLQWNRFNAALVTATALNLSWEHNLTHHPSLPRTFLVLHWKSHILRSSSVLDKPKQWYPVWLMSFWQKYLLKATFRNYLPRAGKIRSRTVSKSLKWKNSLFYNNQVALGIWNIHLTSLYDFQVFAVAFVKMSISKGKRTVCLWVLHLSKDTLPTWKEIKATLFLWGDPAVIPLQI